MVKPDAPLDRLIGEHGNAMCSHCHAGLLTEIQPKGTDRVDALTFQAEVRRMEKLMYRVSMSYLGHEADASAAVRWLWRWLPC